MVKTTKIGIIGGGAAGMMCAATILETRGGKHIEIHIFDKNPKLGVKVALTGGGRCNVTTGIDDMRLLLTKYIRGANFVRSAIAAFPPIKVRQWFEEHGVILKEENDNRVFPVSNRGEDIVKVFEDICKDDCVKLHFNESVLSVANKKEKFVVQTVNAEEKTKKSTFDFLIITTGGNAYQSTGSTGDGYDLAKSLGHNITPLNASLNSFTTEEVWCYELAGISLQDARFDIILSSGEKKSVSGPMLFTHFGISGPAVFALAAQIAFEEINEVHPYIVNLVPNTQFNYESCNEKILKEIKKEGTKPMLNIIMNFVPRRLAETLLQLTNTKAEYGADLKKEDRLNLVKLLTGDLELTLTSKKAGAEFVTAGGVELEEVERNTMESKLVKGLYFAGEVLNIDAVTGGFNLQSAWATGRSAGNAISRSLSK